MELIIRVLGISETKHEIKKLKFFIFPIDSMSELVYYLIKIRDKEIKNDWI